jgi:outer membrane protein, heavy metal efflux system
MLTYPFQRDDQIFYSFKGAKMKLFIFFSLVFIFIPFTYGQEQKQEELQALINETIQQNPEIAAEQSRVDMMKERIPQAGALADPEFTFKQMEFPDWQFNEAMYQNFELMQMIMFPTKLWTRKDIASTALKNAQWGQTAKIVEIIAKVRSAYAMLWDARTRLDINIENQQLLDQMLRIVQTQYSVGQASQQEVLKTGIELAKARSDEAVIRQEITSGESMMHAILNRPNSVPIGHVTIGSLIPIQNSLTNLLRYASDHHPMLSQDSLNIFESDLMVTMAKQEYIPDFKISIERVTYPMIGTKSWSLMAGITIPFAPWSLSKASARVQEAQADHSMRQSMLKADLNMVESGIRESYSRVKAYETQVRSFEQTILPQSTQSLQSSLTEYQSGRTSYLMLLDAFRMNQDMKMEATMIRMYYEKELANLQKQVGIMDIKEIPLEETK